MVIIPVTRGVKGYNRLAEKYVIGKRNRLSVWTSRSQELKKLEGWD